MSEIMFLIFGKHRELALLVSECNMKTANGENPLVFLPKRKDYEP